MLFSLQKLKAGKLHSSFHHVNLSQNLSNKRTKYLNLKNQESILQFLLEIKQKYNFTTPEDWNSLSTKHIQSSGGINLLTKLKYSLYELKCLACPEGKSIFTNNSAKTLKYWENKENVHEFISQLKNKYNLNTPEDWNSITSRQIQANGGWTLLKKYSILDLKCMACPEGKVMFNYQFKSSKYWDNIDNIQNFLLYIKQKYNLNTPEDWNSITQKHIQLTGGSGVLKKYSMFELKCLACPEGKSIFNNPHKSSGYWENKENILDFLAKMKQKYNLQTPEDWNSITATQIQSNGGSSLLQKYSMYELKCLACPEGETMFNNPHLLIGYWENKENILGFLEKMKQKYNLQTIEDWDAISTTHIQCNGGSSLLNLYSMYELKCMACPQGKSIFNNPNKSSGYWENRENIQQFLMKIKDKNNFQTPEDWNNLNQRHIQSHGGGTLLNKYSLYELKCIGCPEGASIFNKPKRKNSLKYWEDETNINNFFEKLKNKYQLKTLSDWKRISIPQILSQGGSWLFHRNNENLKIKIQWESPNITTSIPFKELISDSIYKRSSQRWLFLQVQKLFPDEEIVEDYFHSEISRISGANVQFDVFMIKKNIAIEYHGKQHYEDIPTGFSNLETYQQRDVEKENLCKKYGIQLIVIPYWWDNKLDSLRTTLHSEIKL